MAFRWLDKIVVPMAKKAVNALYEVSLKEGFDVM